MGTIVAVSTSKRGGPCASPSCQEWIPRAGFIAKVATTGPSTAQGNGPGIWVCRRCAEDHDWDDEVLVHHGLTYDDYVPKVLEDLPLDQRVPRGFVMALKHSDYTRWAYLLGRHQANKEDNAT